jgi:hypothetical protein
VVQVRKLVSKLVERASQQQPAKAPGSSSTHPPHLLVPYNEDGMSPHAGHSHMPRTPALHTSDTPRSPAAGQPAKRTGPDLRASLEPAVCESTDSRFSTASLPGPGGGSSARPAGEDKQGDKGGAPGLEQLNAIMAELGLEEADSGGESCPLLVNF